MNDATVRFGYDGAKLNAGLKDAEGRIKRTASKMEKSMSGIRGLMAGGGLLFAGKQATDTVVTIDRLTRGMTTLEGSAEGAKQRMDSLREASRLPGLDFEQAIQGDIRLRSVGLSAELSREALIQMGNALSLAGGTAADLDGVVLALTQIVSKGKVSAEEINQIAERVPQVRAVMKDMFGTADTGVLQRMNIDAETFIATLIEGFGRLDRAQAGLDEKMTDFTASVKAATNGFAQGFVTDGVEGASRFGKALEDNLPMIQKIGTVASDALGGAVDWTTKAAEAVGFWGGQTAAFLKMMAEEGPVEGAKIWQEQVWYILQNQQAVKDQTTLLREQTKVTEDLAKATAKASKLANPAGLNEMAGSISGTKGAESAATISPENKREEDSNSLFSAQERLRKAQQDADREQMTSAQKIAALQADIAAEEAAAAAFGTLESKGGQAAQIDHQTKALELQKQMRELTKQDEDEAKKQSELLTLQEQGKRNVREEIGLLKAKKNGQDEVVKSAERELRIREKTKSIMEQTGANPEQARKAAEQMDDLENAPTEQAPKMKGRMMGGPNEGPLSQREGMGRGRMMGGKDQGPLSQREGMGRGQMMGGLQSFYDLQEGKIGTLGTVIGKSAAGMGMIDPKQNQPISERPAQAKGNPDVSKATSKASGGGDLGSKLDKINSSLERVFFAAS
jgi:tape measure domain-containing protein